MKIKHQGKTIEIAVKNTTFLRRYSGLMFRTNQTQNLYFEFLSSELAAIHSYFVFFPFLALWLGENNEVVDFQMVEPFTFLSKPRKPSRKLIEIPLNKQNEKIFKIFVDKGKV